MGGCGVGGLGVGGLTGRGKKEGARGRGSTLERREQGDCKSCTPVLQVSNRPPGLNLGGSEIMM